MNLKLTKKERPLPEGGSRGGGGGTGAFFVCSRMDCGKEKEKRYAFKIVHSPVSAEAEALRAGNRELPFVASLICFPSFVRLL